MLNHFVNHFIFKTKIADKYKHLAFIGTYSRLLVFPSDLSTSECLYSVTISITLIRKLSFIRD